MKKMSIFFLLIAIMSTTASTSFAEEHKPSSWAQVSIDIARARNSIGTRLYSEYQSNITRGDFAYLGVMIYEELTDKTAEAGNATFTDTQDEFVLKAKNLGIVDGYSDGSYKPNKLITREELASLMVNVMNACDLSYNKSIIGDKFTDTEENGWSFESIMIAKNNGVVKGTSDTLYSPKGNATREAAISMYINLVQKFDEYTGTVNWSITEDTLLDDLNKKLNVPAGFTVQELNTTVGIYVPKATNGLYASVTADKWEPTYASGLHYQIVLKNKNISTDSTRMKIVREWTYTDLDNVIKAIQQPAFKLTDFRKEDIVSLINYSEKNLFVDGSLGNIDAKYVARLLIYDNATVQLTMEPSSQDFYVEVYLNSDLKNGIAVMNGTDSYEMTTLSDIVGKEFTLDLRSR